MWRRDSSDNRTSHAKSRGIVKSVLDSDGGKKRTERDRMEYFSLIMKGMGCGTFRKVDKFEWDRFEWKRVVASNHS